MSTPIETNTEELQEILNAVNNLPNAGGGGFSIPVIDCMALGFPDINGETVNPENDIYMQKLEIDEETFNSIISKMEIGIVKLIISLDFGTETRNYCAMCKHTVINDDGGIGSYAAYYFDCEDGTRLGFIVYPKTSGYMAGLFLGCM